MTIVQSKGSPKRPLPSATRSISKRAFKHLKLKRPVIPEEAICNKSFPKAMDNLNWRQKRFSPEEHKLSDSGSAVDTTDRENSRLPIDLSESVFQKEKRNAAEKYQRRLDERKPHMSPQAPRLPSFTELFDSPLQPGAKNVCTILNDVEVPFQSSSDTRLHLFQITFGTQKKPNISHGAMHSNPGSMQSIRARPCLAKPFESTFISAEEPSIRHKAAQVMQSIDQSLSAPRGNYKTNIVQNRASSFRSHSSSAVAATGTLLQSFGETHQSESSLISGRASKHSSRQSRDAAFKKMLQKLHSSTDRHHTHNPPSATSKNASAHVNDTFRPRDHDVDVRKPVAGSGRRCATVSDNVINYSCGNVQSAEVSMADFHVRVDTQMTMGSLNPRAREFLSFRPYHSPITRKYIADTSSDHLYVNFGASGTSSLPADERSMSGNNNEGLSNSSRSAPNTFIGADPQAYHDAGPLPTVFASFGQTIEGAEAPGLPQLTHAFLPTIGGFHIVPTMYSPAYKPGISSPHAGFLSATNIQAPQSVRASSQRPRPVPKPKVFSASSQQAYEAWIEWRKANEPGYAMECKQRQQRRSQRTKAACPKPDSPIPITA